MQKFASQPELRLQDSQPGSTILVSAVPPASERAASARRESKWKTGDVISVAVVFLLFSNAVGVAVNSHGAPQLLGLVLIGALAIPVYTNLRRNPRVVVPTAFLFILLYLLAQLVSTMRSPDPSVPFQLEVRQFLIEGVALFFLIVNSITTTRVLRRALYAIVIAGAILSLFSVIQWATGSWSKPFKGFALLPVDYLLGLSPSPRVSGPLGDPNYYAQILLVPIVLIPFLLRNEGRRLARFALCVGLALCVGALILTYSRGAGVALVIAFVVCVVFREISARTVLLTVVGAGLILLAVPGYRSRLSTLSTITSATSTQSSSSRADSSIQGRSTEMIAAAHAFADHPVLGVGPGMFPAYYQEYAQRTGGEVHETAKYGKAKGGAPERAAHDIVLGLAADVGILGLVAFAGALLSTLFGLLRVRRRERTRRPELTNLALGLFVALVAYMTAGLFLSLAFERYYWLMLALGSIPLALSTSSVDA